MSDIFERVEKYFFYLTAYIKTSFLIIILKEKNI